MSSFFENWNRYYEPTTGRYLQPEPLWVVPQFVARNAKEGRSISAYSYALSNPLLYTDKTGLAVEFDGSCDKHRDIYEKFMQMINASVLTSRNRTNGVSEKLKKLFLDTNYTHRIKCDERERSHCGYTGAGVTTLYVLNIKNPNGGCLCNGKLLAHELGHVINGFARSETVPNICSENTSCSGIVQ